MIPGRGVGPRLLLVEKNVAFRLLADGEAQRRAVVTPLPTSVLGVFPIVASGANGRYLLDWRAALPGSEPQTHRWLTGSDGRGALRRSTTLSIWYFRLCRMKPWRCRGGGWL